MNIYALAVALARESATRGAVDDPAPGDLVVEVTGRKADPDAIGWLLDEGEAAYNEDGSGPTRHVWDVMPLNPDARLQNIGGKPMQRWENALFYKVPESVLRRVGLSPRQTTEPKG